MAGEAAEGARPPPPPPEAGEEFYCRYLFPRPLRLPSDAAAGGPGAVVDDPYRPELRNLFLQRNDTLLNNFEAHLLLANLGNIDWRPLLNLWSVLEYLTKYTAKGGQASGGTSAASSRTCCRGSWTGRSRTACTTSGAARS